MENTSASNGDIIPADQPMRAADRGHVPAAALTGGQFIDQVGDGALSGALHEKLRDLAADMQDIGGQTGKKTTGKVTLTLDLSFEDGAFRIGHDIKVKTPELPRPKAIMWTDEHNRFTRFPPNQGQFFGVRDVAGGTGSGLRTIG